MISSLHDALDSRTSIHQFQPDRPLDDACIAALARLATTAPTAYNLQNWRLIAVRSPEAKTKLQAAAFGQQKIADASVAFIVCGTLAAHVHLAAALQPSVAAGILQQPVADAWVAQAHASHEGNAALQRDEAQRSASMAAMTLMLAAQGMGLGSCAMGGFDAQQVAAEFGLTSLEVPVMIVAVGHPADDKARQKPRKPLAEVLTLV